MCENDKKYFLSALDFFHDIQWIYNSPVTEILLKNSLDKFPAGWLETLENLENNELNDFVVERKFKENWPSSLIQFLEKCKQVDRLSKPEFQSVQLPSLFQKGLNPKKQHEIFHLANLVHKYCLAKNISTIVDFGAGLGYICQLLHHLHGYKILGLESNAQNVKTARKRQKEFYPNSTNFVKYSQFEVTHNSVEAIQLKIKEEFGDSESSRRICLIGLHACGDLSISISKIFTELKNAELLILISCCYHKLLMVKSSEENAVGKEFFQSFPLSDTLKNVVQSSNYSVEDFLKRTFLRLACQEPAERWKEMSADSHKNHAFYVIARAVLELYTAKNQLRLKKLVQKATRKSQCKNFEMYLKDCLNRYNFESIENKDLPENIEKDLTILWNEYKQKLNSAEIYTGLQLLLQSPAESLILTDRISWLRERGFSAEIIPVMEKSLSPRSHAIISVNNQN